MGAEVIYAIAGIVLFVYGVAGRRIRLEFKDFKLFSQEELARWQRFVFAILGLILLIIPLLPILGITLQPQATTPTIEATPTLFPTNTPTPTTPAPPVQTTAVPPTNTPTDPPANTSTATDTPSPTPTVIFTSTFTPPPITPTRSSPICPSADAEGTVQPAVAIYSITFVVDGNEQVMNDANSLQGLSGNQVRVKEVTICTVEPFEGSGGRVYVEFDPVDQNAQVIASEVKGTQAVSVSPGFTVIPGPDYTWTIGNWRHISVVTVHYPGGSTQNPNCEGGACEVDDRMIVGIQ